MVFTCSRAVISRPSLIDRQVHCVFVSRYCLRDEEGNINRMLVKEVAKNKGQWKKDAPAQETRLVQAVNAGR